MRKLKTFYSPKINRHDRQNFPKNPRAETEKNVGWQEFGFRMAKAQKKDWKRPSDDSREDEPKTRAAAECSLNRKNAV